MSDGEGEKTVVESREPSIQHFIRVRSGHKSRLTYFKNKIENNEYPSIGELESALNRLRITYAKYDATQIKLEELDPTQCNDRDGFEDEFGHVEAAILNKIRDSQNKTPVTNIENTSANNLHTSVSLKLPEIELPKFDGSELNWLDFRSIFVDLIHSNLNLSNVAKFHYLNSCIRDGKAFKLINALSLSNENYPIAWKKLLDYYNNEMIIQKTHVKRMYEIRKPVDNSASSLQSFIDVAVKHYEALKALGVPVNKWDLLLVHHLNDRLDESSRIEIINKSSLTEIQTFEQFIAILQHRCKVLDAKRSASWNNNVSDNHNKSKSTFSNDRSSKPSYSTDKYSKSSKVMVAQNLNCLYCQGNHSLDYCVKFKDHKLTPQERYNFVKQHGLCTNCIIEIHRTLECPKPTCSFCPLKHHSLLHFGRSNQYSTTINTPQSSSTSVSSQNKTHRSLDQSSSLKTPSNDPASHSQVYNSLAAPYKSSSYSQILLGTAVVWIRNSFGDRMKCRAMIDCGSQANFITQKLVQFLKLKTESTHVNISGINGTVSTLTKKVNIVLESRTSNFQVHLNCYVKPKISELLPSHPVYINNDKIPSGIELADPYFFKPGNVDLLIGAEYFAEIMKSNEVNLGKDIPLQNSVFGYVVVGRITSDQKPSNKITSLCSFENLSQNIEKFWKSENFENPHKLSIEEKCCENIYSETVVRTENGRYSVSLPIKSNIFQLGESSDSALRQFKYMETRLSHDNELRQQYTAFMNEYLELNHMEEVVNPDISKSSVNKSFYLPHHSVLRESSLTTRIRVVFNASSKTSSGLSLNDCLMVGPTIQNDLYSIITRFRKHQIAITGDIAKMYRQVLINPDQQDLQRIWWRDSVEKPIQCYRLQTVTYGTASAPFLAIRTLFELAKDAETEYPKAAKTVREDFYVDDLLTGSDSEEEAVRLKNDLVYILSRGCFDLRKIQSNNSNISSTQDSSQLKSILVLGMNWDTINDVFNFSFQQYSITECSTKRSILSEIAQLYDPLGLCTPIVFVAKAFMQILWLSNYQWDDPLPASLHDYWNEFKRQLISIDTITIPRCIIASSAKFIELHGFGDASEKGYGCVIYVRTIDSAGNAFVRFVSSKSRVAPIKPQTVPRLELCGALLLSQLTNKIISALDLKFTSIFLWTDSQITLHRIKSVPSRYTTYVANRIAQIQDLTSQDNWYYIPTLQNPSDMASRGLMPSEFIKSHNWWTGPKFLNSPNLTLPDQPNVKTWSDQLELRKTKILVQSSTADEFPISIFERCSSYKFIIRSFGYVLRYLDCLKRRGALGKSETGTTRLALRDPNTKINEIIAPLSAVEMDNALIAIIKYIQMIEFAEDIRHLRKNKLVPLNSNLRALSPFLDQDNLLRVGGRLNNANIPYDHKHQFLLPAAHNFTKLLVRNEHHRLLHAGPQFLLYSLRQRFWIIGGRNLCRKTVAQCIICTRTRPRNITQIMGQLPEHRVNPSRPFQHVGVDFCGPFLTSTKIRSKTHIKAYIAIFVCFASKAIHMEVVSDLSTNAVIAAFRRFVARRGLCSNVYSDNATNFIGAKAELQDLRKLVLSEVHQHEILKYCIDHGIQWHTIPPRSPHFGGLWEAAVKSAKHHLKRVLGTTSYTSELLSTLIVQVEACLNSRPIGHMSDNPNDYECLTPGHFLVGQPLTTIPDPSLSHLDFNRLNLYQRIQANFQLFWKRWSSEYLSQLQEKRKWTQSNSNIKIGDLVILQEDNVPPLKWPMARIVELHKGNDNHVRVVTVQTQTAKFKRAITRICPLPVEQSVE